MNARDTDASPLVAAALALEEQLEHLEAIVDAARREPLTSQKHLQRAARTLEGVTAMEGKLREALGALVAAIGAAGARQQQAMEALAACAHGLEGRLAEFQALVAERDRFGAEASRVNALMKQLLEEGGLGAAVPQAISELGRVAAAGKALFARAREQGFHDLAREADAVQQQLHALRRKLVQLAPEHDHAGLQTDLEVEQPEETEVERES